MYCFFFNDTATTEIYTLSLHDALPIFHQLGEEQEGHPGRQEVDRHRRQGQDVPLELRRRRDQHEEEGLAQLRRHRRSEEHTSELQSRQYLVCRLLLEKKKNITRRRYAD